MKLNDHQIRNAKPAKKPYKLNDGKGSCICISIRAAGSYGGLIFRIMANGKRFQSVNIRPYHW